MRDCGCSQYDYTCNCALDAELRAARRCSDCVHFTFGTVDDGTAYQPWDRPEVSCFKGHLGERNIVPSEYQLRDELRTASTCDDFEAVSEGE